MAARAHQPWVLLIDDDVMFAEALRRLLEGEAALTTALDASTARARLLEEEFDRVLLDLDLGLYSGRKLHAEVIARRPELAEKIVVMTGGARTNEDEAFLDSLGPKVLLKPFSLDELRSALKLSR